MKSAAIYPIATCATCDAVFVPMLALGRWACRVHPGRCSAAGGARSCCGVLPRLAQAARMGVAVPRLDALASQADTDGCVRVDHVLADQPPRTTRQVVLVPAYRLPPPPAEALVARAALTLDEARAQTEWRVTWPYVDAFGRTATAEADLHAMAVTQVEEAYVDAAFQATTRPGAAAALLHEAKLELEEEEGYVDATEEPAALVARYWRQTTAGRLRQPRVELLVIRQAAPAQEALTVARGRAVHATD
jgi:hypothetical protein